MKIKVNSIVVNGHHFIQNNPLTLQCAYCLVIQNLQPVRRKDGRVIALELPEDSENHDDTCPQKLLT